MIAWKAQTLVSVGPNQLWSPHAGDERAEAGEGGLVDRLAGKDDVAEAAVAERLEREVLPLRLAEDEARHGVDDGRAGLRHRPAEIDRRHHHALVDRHEAGAGAGGGEDVEDRQVEGHRGDLGDDVVGGQRQCLGGPRGEGGGAPLALDDALRHAGRAGRVEDVGRRRRVERTGARAPRRGASPQSVAAATASPPPYPGRAWRRRWRPRRGPRPRHRRGGVRGSAPWSRGRGHPRRRRSPGRARPASCSRSARSRRCGRAPRGS